MPDADSPIWWVAGIFVLFYIISHVQTSNVEVHFDRQNKLLKDFVESSKMEQMIYRPWIFAITPMLQFTFYMFKEMWDQRFPYKFDRELIKCSDGGTIGIDWTIDENGEGRPTNDSTKPILLLMPGLSGGNMNLYTTSLTKTASVRGYKCGTVLFRGAANIPITSAKISCAASYDDAGEVIDYVHKKYSVDKSTGNKTSRLYTYGCSLGAVILGLHLVKDGDKLKNKVDGALLYCCPWDIYSGHEFFFNNFFGLF